MEIVFSPTDILQISLTIRKLSVCQYQICFFISEIAISCLFPTCQRLSSLWQPARWPIIANQLSVICTIDISGTASPLTCYCLAFAKALYDYPLDHWAVGLPSIALYFWNRQFLERSYMVPVFPSAFLAQQMEVITFYWFPEDEPDYQLPKQDFYIVLLCWIAVWLTLTQHETVRLHIYSPPLYRHCNLDHTIPWCFFVFVSHFRPPSKSATYSFTDP